MARWVLPRFCRPREADFLIITALAEERAAVLALLPNAWEHERSSEDDIYTWHEAWLPTRRQDKATYRLIIACLARTGPVSAATLTAQAVVRWRPRYVLVVGIAGGLEPEVHLGDVLISRRIIDNTVGKQTPSGRRPNYEQYDCDGGLHQEATNYPDGWQQQIGITRPALGAPRRHIGALLSGANVLTDENVLRSAQQTYPDLIGVEMESGGVAEALKHQKIPFAVIRGVSDYANTEKNAPHIKAWRTYACATAAAYTVGLLRKGPVPAPPMETGPRAALVLLGLGVMLLAGHGPLTQSLASSFAEAVRPTPVLPTVSPARRPPVPPVRRAQRACMSIPRPLTDNRFRLDCICDGNPAPLRTSRPYESGQREYVLSLEGWTCP